MNIFVGSLPWSIEEADLRESFEAYGTVDSVKIITDKFTGRSKGFGFVEMSNDDEAQAAIEKFNGQDIGGRALNVNEAFVAVVKSTGTYTAEAKSFSLPE